LRKFLTAILLVLVRQRLLVVAVVQARQPNNIPTISRTTDQLERGILQLVKNLVIKMLKGLLMMHMRDGNKLGVVISPQVRPNEVKPLAKSLMQGSTRIFPIDLSVLMYAPDKKADFDSSV